MKIARTGPILWASFILSIFSNGCSPSGQSTAAPSSTTYASKSPAQLATSYSSGPTYYVNANGMGSSSVSSNFTYAGNQFDSILSAISITSNAFAYNGSSEIDTVASLTTAQQTNFTFAVVMSTPAVSLPSYSIYNLFTSGPTNIRWEMESSTDIRFIITVGGNQWQYKPTSSPSGLAAYIVSVSGTTATASINGVDISTQLTYFGPGTLTPNPTIAQFADSSFVGSLYEAVIMPNITKSDTQSLVCYFGKTYSISVPQIASCQ